ncbi:MAG: ribonuclease R [Pseudomonadota bacterium]
MAKPSKGRKSGLPSRETLAAFIRDNPERATKRDIAKAFDLKGENRIVLKHLLREMQDEGVFEKRGKRLAVPGDLPSVTVLEITGRDRDGGLLASPVNWDSDDPRPVVCIAIPKNPRAKVVIPGVGDRVLTRISRNDEGFSGRVIKRLEKPKGRTLAVLHATKSGAYRLLPVDRRDEEFELEEQELNAASVGDLVEIDVQKSGRYGLKRAKIVSNVGSLASEKAVSMIAIHAHEIPHVFPDQVIAEAEAVAAPSLAPNREDWRDKPLITIDPADAKDHDDAVYAEPDLNPDNAGGHIVYVAIADVAQFVLPESALDREALRRSNSVYFPDRVVPMLPERISNDLCSLKENEDRAAMAVRMVYGADGNKLSHTFHRVLMRSHAKLAYEQAQAAIDSEIDGSTKPILDMVLKPLWNAYRALKQARQRRAPLELDLPERRIKLDGEGKVDRIVIPPRLDAHKLIEEFMIQANVAAAETLERERQMLIYRVHDQPSLAKQEALREFLKTLDMSLARGAQMRPSMFNTILDNVRDTENADLVNTVVLRSQSQAEYSPENYGHFGLNLQRYAHFTSPIRRYADLVVHRALISALSLGNDGLPEDTHLAGLRSVSEQISANERRASNAERDTVDRLIALHLSGRVGEGFGGRVSGVTKTGLFVQLSEYGTDGFIPASTLGDDYFEYVEGAHALVGRSSNLGYQLGDTVEVQLAEVIGYAGSMRFEMLSEPSEMDLGTRSRHQLKSKGRGSAKRASGRPPKKRHVNRRKRSA